MINISGFIGIYLFATPLALEHELPIPSSQQGLDVQKAAGRSSVIVYCELESTHSLVEVELSSVGEYGVLEFLRCACNC